ncbi:hypothetical protein ACP70R_043127 [Stipagrostis hirtigluma subsp. patula]
MEGDPGRRRGLSSYALILRDLGGEGDGRRGYTMQLAPLRGGDATREAASGGGGGGRATTAAPRQGRGSGSTGAATGGGATASTEGDGTEGGGGVTADAAAASKLLQDLDGITQELMQGPKNDGVGASCGGRSEVFVPIFFVPKNKKKKSKNKGDMWNRRQIAYTISLAVPLGILIPSISLLPTVYAQGLLLGFTIIWGLGSIGFPMALFGTSGFERGFSRHVVRIVFMAFSLLVVYIVYHVAASVDDSPSSLAPSPSTVAPPTAAENAINQWLAYAFALVGIVVLAGQTYSWSMGCYTGSDKEADSSEDDEDMNTNDLLERLLGK